MTKMPAPMIEPMPIMMRLNRPQRALELVRLGDDGVGLREIVSSLMAYSAAAGASSSFQRGGLAWRML